MLNSLLIHSALYFLSFLLVWVGSGLVVSSISHLARSWRLPAFIISFFILGLLTSLPEITISTIAILNDDPVIVAGNLLGGVIVLLLGVIPLLGVVGNGVKIPAQLDKKQLIFTLLVIVAPAFLTADQQLNKWEAVFLVLLYFSLLAFFSFQSTIWDRVRSGLVQKNKNWVKLLVRTFIGIAFLIGASHQIVNSTLYFADEFHVSPFFVSLIIVAIGTNLPEISIVFRSILSKKRDVAFADYLGSASANTLLLGVFTFLHGQTIYLPNHFFQRFAFLALGLVLFFFFARSRNSLSRKESLILLCLYVSFILFEIFFVTNLN